MSPLIGIFVITLVSSILYNKFDSSSRTTTKSSYYNYETINSKNTREEYSEDVLDGKQDEARINFENINKMDICIFTVVAGNQKFCREKSEENLDRLTLLMMSCHAENEKNHFPKCGNEKTLTECISRLNAVDLEIFKIVKKRALTVCQEVSQQLFMINSQRRAQALLETVQLHSSVMTSFKDNQKLLENITSQTLSRLRAQRVAFLKDMRLLKKYFMKNESSFMEAARAHLTLLSRHKEIIGGLEKDVNVLTEEFLQSLETMQVNFTAFSAKIFQKHGEIMANLNRVENAADKILKQLELIEEYGYTITIKNTFYWITSTLWVYRKIISVAVSSSLVIYGLLRVGNKILTWIKFVLMVSTIMGIIVEYKHVEFLLSTCFLALLAEVLIWCFTLVINRRTETADLIITDSNASSVFDANLRETRGRSGTSEDTLANGDVHESTRMSVIRIPSGSISGVTVVTPIQGGTTGNTGRTLSTSTATENEIDDQCVRTAIRDSSGSLEEQGGSTAKNRDNMEQDSTSDVFWNDKNPSEYKRNTIRDGTAGDKPGYCSTQCGSTGNENAVDDRISYGTTSVQTATICDGQEQQRSSNDMAVQTSTQCDSGVQTGLSDYISLQTSTTGDRCVQTNTIKATGQEMIARTSDNSQEHTVAYNNRIVKTGYGGGSNVQIDSQNDMGVQTSTRCDGEIMTGQCSVTTAQTETKETSSSQTDTVTEAQMSTRIDNSVQTATSHDQNRGKCGITYDNGVPHLGMQNEPTRTESRQSRIIVSIGDDFSNSGRLQSRPSSPFVQSGENALMETGRQRRVSQDILGNAGSLRDFDSIQVGLQINRSGSGRQIRECGLLTLQGTPCRRRVSAGRCYIHRYSSR